MAVSCHVAFGHYLRTLRERRGLALEEVWTLSQTFPETLNKGYLSRCENGKQKLALPKVVAMSRIYEVPSDVLVERLELDLELEKIGGPATENLSWAQLREAGKNATKHGHRWAAYAFLRDATFKVSDSDLDESSYVDHAEQVTTTFVNCATVGQGLGKYRFALHEFQMAETSGTLGPDLLTLVADRLANVHAQLGDLSLAWKYANLALERLEESPNRRYEPYVYHLHGTFRLRQNEQLEAIPWFQKTYDSHRERGDIKESAQALIGLANCYQESGNLKAAERTLAVARDICTKHSLTRYLALVLAIEGIVDEDSGRQEAAEQKLREADAIAKTLNDRILRFQVEFYLFKHALANRKPAAGRAIRRRLEKLAVSIPDSVEQLEEFRAIKERLGPKK